MIYDLTLCDTELDIQEESGIPSQHLDYIICKFFHAKVCYYIDLDCSQSLTNHPLA